MKKIHSINLTRLRVEEDFGFMKLIEAETANLPLEEERPGGLSVLATTDTVLSGAVNQFTTALTAFDAALKASTINPATVATDNADEARDRSWRGIYGYVGAMREYPDAATAGYAEEVRALFDKYGNPTKLAQTEESGVLHNLLQDLSALESEKRTALALDIWITDLQTKEEAFLAAAAVRTEETAARQTGIVKDTRTTTDAAYRSLVDTVNALAMLNGEADYATFIDHVNAIIDRQKVILKARQTNNAKKNTDEEKPGEL